LGFEFDRGTLRGSTPKNTARFTAFKILSLNFHPTFTMPIYLYWGEDDFALERAVTSLREATLDPAWGSFNHDKIDGDGSEAAIAALNQAMTPPFGSGQRFVHLPESRITQQCSAELLTELERTITKIPDSSVLLFVSSKKPDGRLKSTKLLKKYAEVREFSPIPPWNTDELAQRVKTIARELKVKLSPAAIELLAESVGNNTRQLFGELEKLRLFAGDSDTAIEAAAVEALVAATSQNSLQLAKAIRDGQTSTALTLVSELIARNEAALRIVATLNGQFRTWLWIKLAIESGERSDKAIAEAAELGNPKRVYFLKKEVAHLSLTSLQAAMSVLLDLEYGLKRGGDDLTTLQTKTIELCQLFSTAPASRFGR
jgi:DNA polymerase-3 subunit delta